MVSSYCLRKNVGNVYKKLLSNISNAFGDILPPRTNMQVHMGIFNMCPEKISIFDEKGIKTYKYQTMMH